jgi:hypothetical protein
LAYPEIVGAIKRRKRTAAAAQRKPSSIYWVAISVKEASGN